MAGSIYFHDNFPPSSFTFPETDPKTVKDSETPEWLQYDDTYKERNRAAAVAAAAGENEDQPRTNHQDVDDSPSGPEDWQREEWADGSRTEPVPHDEPRMGYNVQHKGRHWNGWEEGANHAGETGSNSRWDGTGTNWGDSAGDWSGSSTSGRWDERGW